MPKKKSPRSIPRTQQDVDRARKKGIEEGATYALDIMLITLKDLGEPDDYISKFERKFNKTLASITEGKEIKPREIKEALRDEYEIEVEIK